MALLANLQFKRSNYGRRYASQDRSTTAQVRFERLNAVPASSPASLAAHLKSPREDKAGERLLCFQCDGSGLCGPRFSAAFCGCSGLSFRFKPRGGPLLVQHQALIAHLTFQDINWRRRYPSQHCSTTAPVRFGRLNSVAAQASDRFERLKSVATKLQATGFKRLKSVHAKLQASKRSV